MSPLGSMSFALHCLWFLIFFMQAWRFHVLGFRNVAAALLAGMISSYGWPTLSQLGKPYEWDLLGYGKDFQVGCWETLYVIAFIPLFAVLRRLFRLHGFGRDFWLLVACMAPLAWIMYFIVVVVGTGIYGC